MKKKMIRDSVYIFLIYVANLLLRFSNDISKSIYKSNLHNNNEYFSFLSQASVDVIVVNITSFSNISIANAHDGLII